MLTFMGIILLPVEYCHSPSFTLMSKFKDVHNLFLYVCLMGIVFTRLFIVFSHPVCITHDYAVVMKCMPCAACQIFQLKCYSIPHSSGDRFGESIMADKVS